MSACVCDECVYARECTDLSSLGEAKNDGTEAKRDTTRGRDKRGNAAGEERKRRREKTPHSR